MKKTAFTLLIFYFAVSKIVGQPQYKYCELVGYAKIFSSKLFVAIDSGGAFQMVTDTAQEATEYKNQKFYVTTNESMYEGKVVQTDSKGKYIWKRVEVNGGKAKRKIFNSMIDGMNYMGKLGWEFVQAYTVTVGEQNVYHWLLKKKG